ncbi:MAG TPA: tetratricopeptide repeat protein, partial [Anaerolineales bacterium]|nr:tetratricopeptide repeat protein [Anaerolineales bacterium]
LKILENGPESVELAHAISAISRMHMLASENEQAIIWGERALALAERLGAEEVIVHALNNLGTSLTPSIDPERGLRLLQDSLDRALVLNLPQHLCRAYLNISESLVWNCRYVEAEESFGKLLAFSRQTHIPLSEGVALVGLAGLDNWTGHWKEMLERREEILAWYDETLPLGMVQILASTLLGRIYNDLGQYDLARQELESSLSNARTIDELNFTVPHLGQLARTLTIFGLDREVFDLVREFLALIEHTPSSHALSIHPLLFACRWLANRSDSQDIKLFHGCLNSLKQIEAHSPTLESRAALAEGQGYDALKNQDVSSAIKYFRQAVKSWGDLGRPYDQVRALSSLGQTLNHAGDVKESQSIYIQSSNLIAGLAEQLEDREQKSAFLTSQLIKDIREQKERYS